MAEYIEREALAEKLRIGYCGNCSARYNELKCRCCDVDDVISEIEEAPTADVVEVVRCKDCKFFREYNKEHKSNVEKADGDCYFRVMYSLDEQFGAVQYHDYCSLGAKMDGKGEGE